jgi:hypothetical protein
VDALTNDSHASSMSELTTDLTTSRMMNDNHSGSLGGDVFPSGSDGVGCECKRFLEVRYPLPIRPPLRDEVLLGRALFI